jgi:hypothetical protein
MEDGAVRHIIERGPPKDHPSQICFNLVQRFQRRRFKCDILSATPPFSINFRCQIENQVSDYRLLGTSSCFFWPDVSISVILCTWVCRALTTFKLEREVTSISKIY